MYAVAAPGFLKWEEGANERQGDNVGGKLFLNVKHIITNGWGPGAHLSSPQKLCGYLAFKGCKIKSRSRLSHYTEIYII